MKRGDWVVQRDTVGGSRVPILQVAVFAVAVAVMADVALMAIELVDGFGRSAGFSPALGDSVRLGFWDVIKALVTAGLLFAIAARLKSWTLVIFGLVFVLVAVLDDATLHGPIGSLLGDRLELSPLTAVVPAAEREWGQLIVLSIAGMFGLLAIWLVPLGQHEGLRFPRRILTALLALLFLFAGVVDLLAASFVNVPLQTVEEVGEHLVLSIILGYVIALYVDSRGRTGSVST